MLQYILLFICLSLLSVIFNPILNYHSFLYRTLGLIGGLIFFIALHQFKLSPSERDKLLFIIFISGLIEAGIGIIQYFGPSLRLPFIAFSNVGSIYGTFQQPNVFASFIGTAIVISLFLISRSLFRNMSPVNKTGFYVLVAALSFALLASNSTAGFIGIILGIGALFVSRIRIYKTILKYSLSWFIAVAIGMSCNYITEKVTFKRTTRVFTQEDAVVSGSVRILYYRISYEMFKEKPLFGHGIGNFGSKSLHFQRELIKKNPDYINVLTHATPAIYLSHPHNEILYRLAESGAVGGIGLLILFTAFGYLIFRLGRERGGLYLSLLLPIGFHTQVEFPLYQSIAHFVLFLILCYLPSSHFSKRIPVKVNTTIKTVFLVLISFVFILTISFFIQTLNAHRDIVKYNKFLMSKEEIRPRLLKSALENRYLQQVATRLFMDAKLRIGLTKNNRELIKDFVEWSKNERKVTPYVALFVREVKALHALGLKKEAFNLLDEGLSLYPSYYEKQYLLETKGMLVVEEIKSKLSHQYKGASPFSPSE